MKNMIEFYYNLNNIELHNKEDYYFFNINNFNFILEPYYGDPNKSDDIYKLNTYLSSKVPVNSIVQNRYNSSITNINGTLYILTLIKNNKNNTLTDISYLSNIIIEESKSLERNNWELLWGNKIDYFEQQIGENEKKYPLIRESFDYFIGLGETAISYLVNTKKEVAKKVQDKKGISHISLSKSLYSPLNIILDHKARDLAEYIKQSFFNKNHNIFKELDEYFQYNYFSVYGIRVLFSRIIYPSFYFEIYDDIVSGRKEEKELNTIINEISDYELYLWNIYLYLRKYYDIPEIEWLKKQGLNPRLQP